MEDVWRTYFQALKESGDVGTEHTNRTALENLLNCIKPSSEIKVIHEPKRAKGFGAPDFRIESAGGVIGYIETKKLGENLDKVLKSDQIRRYLSFSHNLILTNYHEFILLNGEELLDRRTLFYLTDLESKRSSLKIEHIRSIQALIEKFFITAPMRIGDVSELASQLAARGRILKEYIIEELRTKKQDYFSQKINGLKDAFKDTLVEDLGREEFADAYAQTVIYGFFLALLQSGKKITIDDASRLIPVNFEVIKEFFNLINDYQLPSHIRWIFNEIVNLINNIDLPGIYKTISYKPKSGETTFTDPYLYFYETFLAKLDAEKRKAKGVYYTPMAVVSFIARSLNEILISKFGKPNGFADPSVTTLDFAVGAGTFLIAIFELIFEQMSMDSGAQPALIRDHILRNFYGFEYLVAPYAICHLKLSQFIKDRGYELKDNERFQVFLTDTLDDAESKVNLFMPVLSKEGKRANEIKKEEEILVITGNPPYNNKSRNNKPWIMDLIKDYKPSDEIKLNLDDDYVKFIRYAHWKMQQTDQGVIGIITNNSFLSGLTHRKMRNALLEEFDEIYIVNLHGSTRQLEKTPNGRNDQNVFDIMQGVAISIFVKKAEKTTKPQLFYYDLFGSRAEKNRFLMDYSMASMLDQNIWTKIDIAKSNRRFSGTKWGKNRFEDPLSYFDKPLNTVNLKKYGEFWGITDIFKEYNSSIQTKRDGLAVHFTQLELMDVLNDFRVLQNDAIREKYRLVNDGRDWTIQKAKECLKDNNFSKNKIEEILYRPFDFRWTFYNEKSKGFIAYPRHKIMQHFINRNNIGLVFMRQVVLNVPYTHFLITDKITDLKLLRSSEGTNFVAPLYIYQDNSNNHNLLRDENGSLKKPNFTKQFQLYIQSLYQNVPTPEEILGYIYALCYHSEYRETYADFLKIDFPRIPFTNSTELFQKLSKLGVELIEHHLMKKDYPASTVYFKGKADDTVEKADFRIMSGENAGKLYINKKQFFENMPQKVWECRIGGYNVLENWLKSRKGRNLSYQDLQHFVKVVNILQVTIEQTQKIDNVIRRNSDRELSLW